MATITSANATLVLGVLNFLPTAQQIQGFSTDDIFTADDVTSVETQMGVDGIFSAGFMFVEKPLEITLQASSPSNAFFDSWNEAQQAAIDVLEGFGTLTLPSYGYSFALITGFLKRMKPIPDARKVLQPRRFQVVWGRIVRSPIGLAG